MTEFNERQNNTTTEESMHSAVENSKVSPEVQSKGVFTPDAWEKILLSNKKVKRIYGEEDVAQLKVNIENKKLDSENDIKSKYSLVEVIMEDLKNNGIESAKAISIDSDGKTKKIDDREELNNSLPSIAGKNSNFLIYADFNEIDEKIGKLDKKNYLKDILDRDNKPTSIEVNGKKLGGPEDSGISK